jgi:plasmid maintenance system antidote protein VapI
MTDGLPVGEIVKKHLTEKCLSVRKAAKECDLCWLTIQRMIKSYGRKVTLESFLRVCKALKVPASQILKEAEELHEARRENTGVQPAGGVSSETSKAV